MGRPDPQIRDAMLAHLRRNHASMCRHWFDDIEPVDLNGGTLRLLVREPVQLRYLQRCCTQQFVEAAQAATGRLLGVTFIDEDEARVEPPSSNTRSNGSNGSNGSANGAPRDGALPNGHGGSGFIPADDEMLLSPDFSFNTFVIGEENRLAHGGALAVAQKPGRAYNPFFIHGGVGLGKTHLLQAICQEAMRINQAMRIYYTSCNDFVNRWHEAVRDGEMSDFRNRFRHLDMLVVDDIHDLAQHERLQEEFFHTFNSLHQAGKQVVLSSDAAPCEIPALQERLTSRFNCGLVAPIKKPCFETRVGIVLKKAGLRNLAIPDDVASYVAAKIDSNIRELEGAITRIQSVAMMRGRDIDLDLAKAAIGEHAPGSPGSGLTIQAILDAISEFYDVRLTDLLSKRRPKSITRPRQVGMYFARRYTRYSLEEIGSYFGGRDHTTVMHAIRTVDERRRNDPDLDRELSRLEERLRNPAAGLGSAS
jgi:chromosomal replication initiator protein